MKKLDKARGEYEAKREHFRRVERALDARTAEIGRELRKLYEERPTICARAALGEVSEEERDNLLSEISNLEAEREVIKYAQKGVETLKVQDLQRLERQVTQLEASERTYTELKSKIKKGLNIKPKYDQWAVKHGRQSAKNYFGLDTALVVGLNGLIAELQHVGKALEIEEETINFLDEVQNEKKE